MTTKRKPARRRGVVHELKTWPEFFAPVYLGIKTCEIRKYDRDFKVGDVLLLREWHPVARAYTGYECSRRVTHIVLGAPLLPADTVVMSLIDVQETKP